MKKLIVAGLIFTSSFSATQAHAIGAQLNAALAGLGLIATVVAGVGVGITVIAGTGVMLTELSKKQGQQALEVLREDAAVYLASEGEETSVLLRNFFEVYRDKERAAHGRYLTDTEVAQLLFSTELTQLLTQALRGDPTS